MSAVLNHAPALTRERALDLYVRRYRRQCRNPEGAAEWVSDWVADPAEVLMAVLHEFAHCDEEAELGIGVREVLERELRKAAVHEVSRLAEDGEIEE